MTEQNNSNKKKLKPLSTALIAMGVLLVGYAGWTNFAAPLLNQQKFNTPPAQVEPVPEPEPTPPPAEPAPQPEPLPAPDPPPAYPTDKLFITIERNAYADGEMTLRVPRLDLTVPVVNGVTDENLQKGVGLYDYSQLPESGNANVSIAGHRDVFGKEFYYIDTITTGDLLYLQHNGKEYTYEYVDTHIVKADDWSPIYSKDYSCLTLTSCDPIGTSTNRIVVTAKLTGISDLPAPDFVVPVAAFASATTQIEEEPLPLTARPVKTSVLVPTATAQTVYSGGGVTIDASNAAQGYIMVKYSGNAPRIKVQIAGSNATTYTYNLRKDGVYEVFPLTSGSGNYSINVYENVTGSQYALSLGQQVKVTLDSPLLPYLYPNQYVNFKSESTTVAKGADLAKGATTDLEVVQNVYNYVISNITYDTNKAAQAQSGSLTGYLPVVDSVLASGKGICFDYAAVMATMLRTQGIPTRLEVGYVSGGTYHAWITVYLAEVGWVNGLVYFDGQTWKLMDPTFASSANSSESIMQFIGNGSNYSTKYVY